MIVNVRQIPINRLRYLYLRTWLVVLSCRIVESLGENVVEVAVGDTVIPTFMSDCGDCADCNSKKSNLCSRLPFKLSPWMSRYESSRFKDLEGEVLYHFLFVSSFSEYTVVDVANVVKVDPALPPNRACLLSCGVSTGNNVFYNGFHEHVVKLSNFVENWRSLGVGAAWRTAGVEPGSTVAIFGLGSIGLAVGWTPTY